MKNVPSSTATKTQEVDLAKLPTDFLGLVGVWVSQRGPPRAWVLWGRRNEFIDASLGKDEITATRI